MSYEVYTISGAPRPWRVLLAFVVKGLDFEARVLDGGKKEHKTPEFVALNPRARTPVLKDGDFVLTESLAIIAYLDRVHPEPPLFGRTAQEHGRIWQVASEGADDLNRAANDVLRPLFFDGKDETHPPLREAAAMLKGELVRAEARLAHSPFLASSAVSAADCVWFPHVRLVLRAAEKHRETMRRLELHPFAESFPRLAAWVERIESLPSYEKAFPPHWRA